jgi:hypothetical protein
VEFPSQEIKDVACGSDTGGRNSRPPVFGWVTIGFDDLRNDRVKSQKPWNPEDELRLLELVNQNVSRPEIAKMLGRTVAAIERRLNIVRSRPPQAD